MKQYKGVPIGYFKGGDEKEQVKTYPRGLFGCLSSPLCSCSCCIVHSCCASWAHAAAMSWVHPGLKKQSTSNVYTQKKAEAAETAARASGLRSERGAILDVESNENAADVRERFENYMFGVWSEQDGNVVLVQKGISTNPFMDNFKQSCFAPCARFQEIDAAVQWRQDTLKDEIRYANPCTWDSKSCFFKCGFEEKEGNKWIYPATIPPLTKQLYGRNLLGRGNASHELKGQFMNEVAFRAPVPSLIHMRR